MRKTLLAAVSVFALISAGAVSPAISQSSSSSDTPSQTESQATPTPKADQDGSGASAEGDSTSATDTTDDSADMPDQAQSDDSSGDMSDQAQSDGMSSGSTDMSSDDAATDTMNQESAAADTGGQGAGDMNVQQPADTHLSSNLTGQPVQNPEGENLADIDDFVIGPDGKISHVIVSFGGFLGLGDKEVMLPWEQLNVTQDEDGEEVVRLAMTQEEIESLPEFVSQEDAAAQSDAQSQPVDEGNGSTGMGTTGSGSSMSQ